MTPTDSGGTAPPAGRPVHRQSVVDLALSALREKILRGDYPEGAPLRQDAVAAELGVSRIPVREALRQLEAEGLVTLSPNYGAVVSTLSLDEIREIFELRALTEADLLARAIPRTEATDVQRATMILDRYREALRSGDTTEWGPLNWQFHAAIYAPAGRPLTLGIVQNLHHQSERYTRMQLALTHGETRADEEHRAILRAVEAGDAGRACALLAEHILGAGRQLVDFLREHRSAGV